MRSDSFFVAAMAFVSLFAMVISSKGDISDHNHESQSGIVSLYNLTGLIYRWTEQELLLVTELRNRQLFFRNLNEYASDAPIKNPRRKGTMKERAFNSFLGEFEKENSRSLANSEKTFKSIFRAMIQYERLERDFSTRGPVDQELLRKATELKVLALTVSSSSNVLSSIIHELRRRISHIRWSWGNLQIEFMNLQPPSFDAHLRLNKRLLEVDAVLRSLENSFAIPY